MRREKSKIKKVILIILACLLLAGGVFCAIYFSLNSNFVKYYEIKLNTNSSELVLSSNKSSLSPNDNIITRPIKFSLSGDSENSYVRAKVVFENYSDDNRVLSFVSQLNFNVKNLETFSDETYQWTYYEKDNAFYLTNNGEVLHEVASTDGKYTFLEKLIVQNNIEQMETLNADGDNVQIGEDVVIHIIFEAIQSNIPNQKNTIENLSAQFNLSATQYEDGFYCENGFITGCDINSETIVLPKKIGNDYVLGIKSEAFTGSTIKQIIAPANVIYFENNAFTNLTNLSFVAIKNQINVNLYSNTFNAVIMDIFAPKSLMNDIMQNYSNFAYITNFKQITEINSSDLTTIPSSTQYLYSSTLKNFDGKLNSLTNLKVVDFPVLEEINEEMFLGLNNLVSVECPNAKIVNNKAFSNCSKLVNVVLNKNLEQIGENSFYACSKLSEANFIKNLKIIPNQAFRGCSSLTMIELNNEQTEIKNSAFYGCSSLRKVSIKNLKSCENYAFGDCDNLRWFYVKSVSDLSLEANCFSKSSGTTNLNMMCVFENEQTKNEFVTKNPQTSSQSVLINIQDGQLVKFEGSIKNLNLSEFNFIGVITKIGDNVFKNNTTITSLTLPYSVKEIGNNVFDGATNLTKIVINNYQVPTISEKTFENVNENMYIYVPSSVLEIYKQTYEEYNLKIANK